MKNTRTLNESLKKDLNKKGLNINDKWNLHIQGNVIEFNLIDDNGKRIFGSTVTVYGFKDLLTKQRKMKINTGTMGAVDNNCIATLESLNLMVTALNNWAEFSKTCEHFMDKAIELEMYNTYIDMYNDKI